MYVALKALSPTYFHGNYNWYEKHSNEVAFSSSVYISIIMPYIFQEQTTDWEQVSAVIYSS